MMGLRERALAARADVNREPLTQGPAVTAHPPEWVGDVTALLAYIDTQQSLMAYYRTGSRPPERVHKALDTRRKQVEAIRATLLEVTGLDDDEGADR